MLASEHPGVSNLRFLLSLTGGTPVAARGRMKLLLWFVLAVCFFPVAGQTLDNKSAPPPCPLTIKDSPTIRGLRLGQSYNSLREVFPPSYDFLNKPNEYGVNQVLLTEASVASREQLEGIDLISLTYFDNLLVDIRINYRRSVEWQSNLHFVSAIVEQLKLPRDGWQERDPSYLVCQDFGVEISGARLAPELRILDRRFPYALLRRKEEVEARKRALFKP